MEITVIRKTTTEYHFTQHQIATILLDYISNELGVVLVDVASNDVTFTNNHDVKASNNLRGLRASLIINET